MKAIVYHTYGSPDVLRLEEVTTPTPKDNEVLIKIHATVVTPPDCAFRQGKPYTARLVAGPVRPKATILGDTLAGHVEAVGSQVRRFKQGDRVVAASGGFGTHAEYICIPEDGALAPKSDAMTYEEAVAVAEGALTALPFLRDTAHLTNGQTILINGASGSVGTAAVQLAKHIGATVTGVCSTANVELVRSLGADEVVDYTKDDFTRSAQTYDVIFDAVAKSSFTRCKGALKEGGVYLSTAATLTILLQTLWSRFGNKRAKVNYTGLRPAHKKVEDLVFFNELAEAGAIRAVIDRRYPLEQTADAHRYVDTGHKKGSVIITLEQS